jgi:hypothetical protein
MSLSKCCNIVHYVPIDHDDHTISLEYRIIDGEKQFCTMEGPKKAISSIRVELAKYGNANIIQHGKRGYVVVFFEAYGPHYNFDHGEYTVVRVPKKVVVAMMNERYCGRATTHMNKDTISLMYYLKDSRPKVYETMGMPAPSEDPAESLKIIDDFMKTNPPHSVDECLSPQSSHDDECVIVGESNDAGSAADCVIVGESSAQASSEQP